MGNEVEKFDPAQLMQGVKDRIKATFVSLIPDDKWEEMCKSEIDRFFRVTTTTNYYNRESSEFMDVVHGVLREAVKSKVKEILQTGDFLVSWNGHNYEVSEAIKKILVDNAPVIFGHFLQNMMVDVIQIMKQR